MGTYISYPPAGGVTTLAAVGAAPAAEGGSISGNTLTLQPADATHPGVVTTGAQTLGAGIKTVAGLASSADILPVSDEGANLGSTAKRWAYVYTDGIKEQNGNSRLGVPSGASNSYLDGVAAPGAADIAHDFNTRAAFNTAGGKLARWKNSGTEKVAVDFSGKHVYAEYTDSSGTPGSATANTVTGRSAIAAASGAAITITNSRCTTTSIVLVQAESADTTCKSVSSVPGNGSFTITPNAATTSITIVRWIIFS